MTNDLARSAQTRRRPTPRRAFVIFLVALMLSGLLNADEMLRTAKREPIGSRRDLLVDVASTIQRVSNALYLNRPRRWIEQATNRHYPANAPVSSPPPTTAASAASTTGPPTAAQPLRLAIVGDSVMVALGQSLVTAAKSTGVLTATLDARVSTGLTRTDYFDWPARIAEIVARENPGVVVVMFGANDAQGIVTPDGAASFGTDAWVAEYRRRIDGVISVLGDQRAVYWLGQPIMRDAALSSRMRLLNEIYSAAAASHPNVRYVDTWALTADTRGGYSSYVKRSDGSEVLARMDDGVHFTMAGADIVAGAVFAQIKQEGHIPR